MVLERMTESVLITTADLDRPGPTIVYVNPQFERMTGWSRAEIVGRSPRVLQGRRTDPAALSDLRRIARGEPWEGQVVNYRKDGTEFVMEWSVVPLTDHAGVIRHYVAVQRDVSRRVALERQLAEATWAKTNFMAMMSHELRTPLDASLDAIERLLSELGPGSGQDQLRGVQVSSRTLLAQVDAILHYVDASAVTLPFAEAEVDLGELAARCLEALAPAAAVMEVQLSLRRDMVLRLRGNERMLERICTVLVGNAIKFNHVGGRVEVELLRLPSGVGVEVRDSGIGIPPEALWELDQPFQQAETGPERSYEGIGLGLAIARRAVEMHGGSLTFMSTPGQGTTAMLLLPVGRLIEPDAHASPIEECSGH